MANNNNNNANVVNNNNNNDRANEPPAEVPAENAVDANAPAANPLANRELPIDWHEDDNNGTFFIRFLKPFF